VVTGVIVVVRATRPVPPPVATREAMLDVRDGPGRVEHLRLDTTLYLPQHTPAPAVLLAHGFGATKRSVDAQARTLAQRGLVVLAWSARGFGRSGGQIALNSPDYEVTDARELVDWLATQPEVTKDAPGDPRVAVTGDSYGGALALMLAGTDKRIDALAPVISYNDLVQALMPNYGTVSGQTPATATDPATAPATAPGAASGAGTAAAPAATATPAGAGVSLDGVFKRSWASLFFTSGLAGAGETGTGQSGAGQSGAGAGGSAATGLSGAGAAGAGAAGAGAGGAGAGGAGGAGAGGQPLTCGRFRPDVCAAFNGVAVAGRPTAQAVSLLAGVSPKTVTGNITAPTLLVQGEQDTLFGLDQADANARQITAAGGKVDMIWYTGGHDGGAPDDTLRGRIDDWLVHHLTGQGQATGDGFRYSVLGAVRENGPVVRNVTADAYPGLAAGSATLRQQVALDGPLGPVFAPAGGSPSSVSGFPGLGGALAGTANSLGALNLDIPGEFASFVSDPLAEPITVAGAPRVTLEVSGIPGQPGTGEAVLFAKLYDVGTDGKQALPGGGVAALRVALPADGSAVDVDVTLPGIVRGVAAGHRLKLVVSSTDQSYAGSLRSAVYLVSMRGQLSVPSVPGRSAADPVPLWPVIGIGAILLAVLLGAALAALRARRARRAGRAADPELAGVPLVITDLVKRYQGGFVAVNGLSFRVERGMVLGLLGPNGAGKTTALRMLMGLITPTAGEIRVFGRLVTPGAPVLSRLGSFVEGPGFLPHLSGRDNLRLYWAAGGRPVADARTEEALRIAGLGAAVDRRVGTYSQGMRQRLAIAQAMLGLPDLLVLDEPTNGLDPPQIHHMREVLRRYAADGRTVLVSSHLLAEVEQTCSHVVVMHHGALVAQGEVGEIAAGSGQATLTVDDPDRAVRLLSDLAGVTEVERDGDAVHATLGGMPRSVVVGELVRAGIAVDQAGPRRRLEDAFLALVGEGPVQ
jgi:ABC-2 type transport system ATP-binding protein